MGGHIKLLHEEFANYKNKDNMDVVVTTIH